MKAASADTRTSKCASAYRGQQRIVLDMDEYGLGQQELGFDEAQSDLGVVRPVRRPRPQIVGRLLHTPEEAATMLGIGRTKIYELLRLGLIESVHIGACRRVPLEALEEYVRDLRRGA